MESTKGGSSGRLCWVLSWVQLEMVLEEPACFETFKISFLSIGFIYFRLSCSFGLEKKQLVQKEEFD